MRKSHVILALAIMAVTTSGCSTRPRSFAASVGTPVADRVAFESDYRTCQQLVAAGHKSNFKGAAATALTTGVGTVGTGAAIAGLGMGGVNIGTGAVSASFAAMPVIGILAGFGVSRAIRGGRERKFKRDMGNCLGEYGYSVDSWVKLDRKADPVAEAGSRVGLRPAPEPGTATVAAEEDHPSDAVEVAALAPQSD